MSKKFSITGSLNPDDVFDKIDEFKIKGGIGEINSLRKEFQDNMLLYKHLGDYSYKAKAEEIYKQMNPLKSIKEDNMQIPIPVYKSKYTSAIKVEETCFQKGNIVRYQLRSGQELDITIDSDKKYIEDNGETLYGYEAIFSDDNKRYFAAEKGIINWEGKN